MAGGAPASIPGSGEEFLALASPHRFANGPATVAHLSPLVWPHVPSPRAPAVFLICCSKCSSRADIFLLLWSG